MQCPFNILNFRNEFIIWRLTVNLSQGQGMGRNENLFNGDFCGFGRVKTTFGRFLIIFQFLSSSAGTNSQKLSQYNDRNVINTNCNATNVNNSSRVKDQIDIHMNENSNFSIINNRTNHNQLILHQQLTGNSQYSNSSNHHNFNNQTNQNFDSNFNMVAAGQQGMDVGYNSQVISIDRLIVHKKTR